MPLDDDLLNRLVCGLTAAERRYRQSKGYPWNSDAEHCWRWQAGRRWLHVNSDGGTCGGFLLEAATGEIYNIKAYGVPDHNKKKKADLGNIASLDIDDPADMDWLLGQRFNYLR